MPAQFSPPQLRNDFVIIVSKDKPELAATALSYLFHPGQYIPIFSYQPVDVEMGADTGPEDTDIYFIQRRRSEEFSVFINNALIENGGCENLIYLGLTEEQKSYLNLEAHYNVLDISDIGDLPAYLGGFGFDKAGRLECSEDQIGYGFFKALNDSLILEVGAFNPTISQVELIENGGMVLVENTHNSNTIIAIGYAAAIGAQLMLVDELGDREEEDITYLLEGWQNGDAASYDCIIDKIQTRLNGVDVSVCGFATFFTDGLPYPLSVRDIPSSMVNLICRPDFFVFNAILSEYHKGTGSAVVFSPVLFKDEETVSLVSLLEFENYYLRKMIGDRASIYNLKNTIELYPFDVLHVCSHGGDVGGTDCQVTFQGIDGMQHSVEFDHTLSIAITPYQDLHSVESMYHFKKLDGLKWRSDELKALGYSHELYATVRPEISKAFDQKKVTYRGKVARIPNSKSITCASKQNYSANFDHLSVSGAHPIIFNNTCWSWISVATSFLVGGARGYVGTLRVIGNDEAVRFAKIFYKNLFETNTILAFHQANQDFLANNPDPIYVYWGLHFSTIKNRRPVNYNKEIVLEKLVQGVVTWERKLRKGEGTLSQLKGRVSDSKWIVGDVFGTADGHFPRAKG